MADFFNRLSYVNSSTIKMFLNYDSGATGINTEYYDINGNTARAAWRNSPISRYDSIFTSTGYNITGLYNHSTKPIRIKGYYSGPYGNFGVQHIWITGTDVSYIYYENVTKTSFTVYWYDPANYGNDSVTNGRFAVEIFGPDGKIVSGGSNYYLSPNTSGKVQFSIYGLSAGTTYQVKVYGVGYINNGTPIYRTITTQSDRPSNFGWTYTKTSGNAVNVTATEWNNFTSRINDFRRYKGYSNYNFTYVYRGNTITASIINEARSAISTMSPPTSVPSYVYSGNYVTAYIFNRLRDSLNSIR